MQRWTTIPVPYERHHAEEWLASRPGDWARGRYLAFAVEVEGRFAGSVDLRPDGSRGAALGYGLAPWARGRGVAVRALQLLLPWGFDAGLDVVHWSAVAGNWPSRRVAWTVGFRVEGLVRGLLELREERVDAWIGSLRREDPLRPAHLWADPPVLDGDGVRLRPHRPDDVHRMVEACSDPQTRHWLAQLPLPYTVQDAKAHLEQMAEDGAAGRALSWAVADPADDGLVGEIAMFGLGRSRPRTCEIGYWTHPRARGRRLTTAAVRLAARHVLVPQEDGGLGLDRVLLRVAEGNTASRRVALRAGFRPTGRDRKAELLRDGTVCDLLRFDLLPEDLAPDVGGRGPG
jgi:RimJ/RimL family protein N-acetyltransferase